jgi:effector-binding domain-containing protein
MLAPPPVTNAPVVTDSPQRHVMYQSFVATHDQLGRTIREGFAALYRRIGEAGVVPAGPPFVIYNNAASPWDLEVCAPVATAVSPTPEFKYREMPGGRVVSLLHVGPYETLGEAYDALQDFIRSQDLITEGPPREFYLSPPETPAESIQTIVEWPIR